MRPPMETYSQKGICKYICILVINITQSVPKTFRQTSLNTGTRITISAIAHICQFSMRLPLPETGESTYYLSEIVIRVPVARTAF